MLCSACCSTVISVSALFLSFSDARGDCETARETPNERKRSSRASYLKRKKLVRASSLLEPLCVLKPKSEVLFLSLSLARFSTFVFLMSGYPASSYKQTEKENEKTGQLRAFENKGIDRSLILEILKSSGTKGVVCCCFSVEGCVQGRGGFLFPSSLSPSHLFLSLSLSLSLTRPDSAPSSCP